MPLLHNYLISSVCRICRGGQNPAALTVRSACQVKWSTNKEHSEWLRSLRFIRCAFIDSPPSIIAKPSTTILRFEYNSFGDSQRIAFTQFHNLYISKIDIAIVFRAWWQPQLWHLHFVIRNCANSSDCNGIQSKLYDCLFNSLRTPFKPFPILPRKNGEDVCTSNGIQISFM